MSVSRSSLRLVIAWSPTRNRGVMRMKYLPAGLMDMALLSLDEKKNKQKQWLFAMNGHRSDPARSDLYWFCRSNPFNLNDSIL